MIMEPAYLSLSAPPYSTHTYAQVCSLSKRGRRKAGRDKRGKSESQTKGETVEETKTGKDKAIRTRKGQVKGEQTKTDREVAGTQERKRKESRKEERKELRGDRREGSFPSHHFYPGE